MSDSTKSLGLPEPSDDESAATLESDLQALVALIRASKPAEIAAQFDLISTRYGAAAAAPLANALAAAGLADSLMLLLRERAETSGTAESWSQLANVALAIQRTSDAYLAVTELLKIEPDSLAAKFQLIIILNRNGAFSEALSIIEKLTKQVTDEGDLAFLNFQKALAQVGLERPCDALDSLDLAQSGLASLGLEVDAGLVRSRALSLSKDFDKAEQVLEDLLPLITNQKVRSDLRLNQAGIAVSAERWKDAARRFDEARAEIPLKMANERNQVQLAKIQTLALRDIDLVLSDLDALEEAWKLPEWPPIFDLRMSALLAANRLDAAWDWVNQRLFRTSELPNHPAAFYFRAELGLKLNKVEQALEDYERAATIPPSVDEPRAWIAALASGFSIQRWKTVFDAYAHLLEIDPAVKDEPTLRVMMAMAHLYSGEAEKSLDLLKGVQPPLPAFVALAEVCRCQALERLGRRDDALIATLEAIAKLERYSKSSIPPESLLSLRLLRAQVLNDKGNSKNGNEGKDHFVAARDAATQVIESSEPLNPTIPGLAGFLRGAALMQRSLAFYRLNQLSEAQKDIDSAIVGFEKVRRSGGMKLLQRAPNFDEVETSMWFAKGAIFDAQQRNEEALSAYARAERLEKQGSVAATALGSALVKTGAIDEALVMFDRALGRASSNLERASALAGKGRAWVRLRRYESAITDLQAALDARLEKPDDDPRVFELLGIAYNALGRTAAAHGAFERAWHLTSKKSANLARGVTAARLTLENPESALDFLNRLPERLRRDRTLLFNRALALDALGRRREAIRDLVRAKNAGLDRAKDQLDRLDAPAGLGRWTHYWFGAQASWARFAFGLILLLVGATGLAAPFFQWWLRRNLDWYLMLVPSVVALVLLALPNIKLFTFEAQGVKLSAEPFEATGREASHVSAPETFNVPMMDQVMTAVSDTKV